MPKQLSAQVHPSRVASMAKSMARALYKEEIEASPKKAKTEELLDIEPPKIALESEAQKSSSSEAVETLPTLKVKSEETPGMSTADVVMKENVSAEFDEEQQALLDTCIAEYEAKMGEAAASSDEEDIAYKRPIPSQKAGELICECGNSYTSGQLTCMSCNKALGDQPA